MSIGTGRATDKDLNFTNVRGCISTFRVSRVGKGHFVWSHIYLLFNPEIQWHFYSKLVLSYLWECCWAMNQDFVHDRQVPHHWTSYQLYTLPTTLHVLVQSSYFSFCGAYMEEENKLLLQVVFWPPHVHHGIFTRKVDLKQENSFEQMIKLTSYTHIHKTELPPCLVP